MAMRYDGKVAVVTGAGNGIGKMYALLLGSRGAKVVVNDLGGSTNGEGGDSRAADLVVQEIKAGGGEAVANYDSVEFGEKIIKTAVDAFGTVDILVNNAGILRDTSLAKMTQKDWDLIYTVHVKGTYSTTKAAWPYMMKQKYGRIVNVASSAGIYGNFGQTNYGMAKLGIAGFSFGCAVEGKKKNIKVNVIAPFAGSRMTETVMPPDMVEALKPEYVAPMVGYLCHENCDPTGGLFELGGGWISKLRWQRSKGAFFQGSFTVDDVAKAYETIENFDDDAEAPEGVNSAFGPIMENLAKM
jgi:NAD(P)-dependent dehydrogenase (short-subunit alcohol dehydrogenase family)